MILWFGKKKKRKELEAAGAAMETEAPASDAAGEARQVELQPGDGDLKAPHEGLDPGGPHSADPDDALVDLPGDASEPIEVDEAPAHEASPLPPPATSPASGGGEALTSDKEDAASSSVDNGAPPSGDGTDEADDAPGPDLAPGEPDPVAETKKPGFLKRLTSGLSRSSSRLADGLTGVFTKRKLDEETLEELEDLLIASDLGAGVAARVTTNLAKDRFDKEVTDTEIKQALATEITSVLKPREKLVDFSEGPRPRVVLFVGVNGSGKTTTIGKIASKLKAQGAKALLVAGDTFRAAAIEQLTVWGERADIPVLSKPTGADAAGLVYEAVEKAQREDYDLVLVDTAGRLQNKAELMAELAKIIRVTRKLDPQAPHDVILVLDATVGQNALSQVEAFRHTAEVTGLVMTKLDGTAKGGVLVAVADRHDLPIHFIGVGERAEDLQPFSAQGFARALVGLEDVRA